MKKIIIGSTAMFVAVVAVNAYACGDGKTAGVSRTDACSQKADMSSTGANSCSAVKTGQAGEARIMTTDSQVCPHMTGSAVKSDAIKTESKSGGCCMSKASKGANARAEGKDKSVSKESAKATAKPVLIMSAPAEMGLSAEK